MVPQLALDSRFACHVERSPRKAQCFETVRRVIFRVYRKLEDRMEELFAGLMYRLPGITLKLLTQRLELVSSVILSLLKS